MWLNLTNVTLTMLFLCFQAYDVFTSSTVTGLNATTVFTVSINPSGVVMWYIIPQQKPRQSDTLFDQHKKASQFMFHKPKPGHRNLLWIKVLKAEWNHVILILTYCCTDIILMFVLYFLYCIKWFRGCFYLTWIKHSLIVALVCDVSVMHESGCLVGPRMRCGIS